ncbi:hypothetical protein Gotur_025427 [Gossypium turneri]
MPICCLSTTSHGIKCLIVTKMKLSIILRIFLLLYCRNYRLVKKLDTFSFLTLHIERKMDLL